MTYTSLETALAHPRASATRQRPRALAAWPILICIAMVAVSGGPSFAQSPGMGLAWRHWEAGRWGGAAWSESPFVYGPYFPAPWYWYGACYPFVSCTAYLHYRSLEERWQRLEALRWQAGETGYPTPGDAAATRFPLPEATLAPEAELQPEYRDTGKIRPGFEHSGELLPDFAERRRAGERSP